MSRDATSSFPIPPGVADPPGSPFYVGDDDHADPWISRGGRNVNHDYHNPEILNPKDAAATRDGKPPLDLIEHAAEVEIAAAMKHGADKYGRRNYRTIPIRATVYGAAIRRHVGAWLNGEDLDPESGLSHLAHIGANINVLFGAIDAEQFVDDRHPPLRTEAQEERSTRSNRA